MVAGFVWGIQTFTRSQELRIKTFQGLASIIKQSLLLSPNVFRVKHIRLGDDVELEFAVQSTGEVLMEPASVFHRLWLEDCDNSKKSWADSVQTVPLSNFIPFTFDPAHPRHLVDRLFQAGAVGPKNKLEIRICTGTVLKSLGNFSGF